TAYSGTIFTTGAGPARRNSGSLSLIAGDFLTVYYNDANTGAGAKLIERTISVSPNYAAYFDNVPIPFTFPGESTTNMRSSPGGLGYRVTLPFDFPFYGKKYRELRAYPEGFVQFDTALVPACLDEPNFAAVTGI